tara:strand:- start:6953 stop:7150 length:198 start_codon:yes stop_codon:yes gene_type:complete
MKNVKNNFAELAYDLSQEAIVTKLGYFLEKAEKPKKITFDFATGKYYTLEGMLVIGFSELVAIKA